MAETWRCGEAPKGILIEKLQHTDKDFNQKLNAFQSKLIEPFKFEEGEIKIETTPELLDKLIKGQRR